MDITRWSTPRSDWWYSLQPKTEKLGTVSKNKARSWLWLTLWTPIAKFRLKLKKVGKTTRTFRHDLNQIPYNYTVEVTNRFKGLDLLDRVPEELGMEVCDTVQEVVIKTIPKRKKYKKGKMVVWGGLTNSWKRKEAKVKGEKEKYTHPNAEFQWIARRDKKAFFSDQCKEIEKKQWNGKD